MRKFYYHFAAAYGTIWLALVLTAIVTQSQINTGEFGLYGFIVIALVYAFIASKVESRDKIAKVQQEDSDKKLAELEDKINQLKMEMMLRDPGAGHA